MIKYIQILVSILKNVLCPISQKGFVNMIKQSKLGLLLIFAVFVLFLLPSSASAFSTGLEENSQFIAAKGTIPDTINQKWTNSLDNCWYNLTKNKPYSQFDISIVNYVGTDSNYIRVDLDSYYQEQMNETRIEEMYQNIEDYCEQTCGLSEVPIVFMWNEEASFPELGEKGFGLMSFEQKKQMPWFIEFKGTLPNITEDDKKKEWYDNLYSSAPVSKVQNYANENGVALTGFGYHMDGYLEVGFVNEVDEETVSEMYEIIETHYEQVGIYDVPVVFIIEGEVKEETPGFTTLLLVLGFLLAVKFRKK